MAAEGAQGRRTRMEVHGNQAGACRRQPYRARGHHGGDRRSSSRSLGAGPIHPGEQLTEASIAAAFQVSRGPVREALKRLTEQGLLVSERNRGVFVPILSDEDVRDIYRLRGRWRPRR